MAATPRKAPLLSPAESRGLAGATLEARVHRAVGHIADATLARIALRLKDDATANDLIYDHEGKPETVRIMLRPLLAMREQLAYVHHVCLELTEALSRLPALYLEDPRIRSIIAVSDDEAAWLRDNWSEAHRRLNPVYGRLDAVCDFTAAGWQDSLKFMEPNLSGVGGINYGPVAEALVMRDIVPTLIAHDPELRIELPPDQRDLFVQLLIDQARAIGRQRCNLGFVEPKYEEDGPDEQSALSRYLSERHGLAIAHADPRELRLKGGEVFYGDLAIDVAYRDYETKELIALERETGKKLEAMRVLFKENRVVSSLAGDFDHKSGFEILTDDNLAQRYFTADERRLFRRHILWTRLVGPRETLLPHNVEGDLLEFARTHREQLVLKPNRAYGGTGVAIGAATEQGDWETLLNEAAKRFAHPEESSVLQSATRLPVSEFPVVGEGGRVSGEPFYVVMGFAPTDNGLATMCRVSQKQVVNVAQHGGMAAVLVAEAPQALNIPKRSLARAEGATQSLRAEIARLLDLDRTISLLEWDEEVKMPAGGRADRGEQLATLEGLRHELLVSDSLADLAEEVAAETEGDERWQRELHLLARLRREAMAMPEELVRRIAEVKSEANGAWEEARVKNDFKIFAPGLTTLVALIREKAQALAHGGDLYDALMDEHEPGMTRSRLDPVLGEVRGRLVPWVKKASKVPQAKISGPSFAEDPQWELARRLLTAVGFDFSRGRLDRSTHPFTSLIGGGDVRLTIRTRADDLSEVVLTTLHEGGHALYDQGFAKADRGMLVGDAPSMGLHECQARLWENHVGRSEAFWRYLYPTVRDLFGDAVAGLDASAFRRSVAHVRPGAIRTSADEMSYHLHILLRYELENALISGQLGVPDLRAAWNEKSGALLGVVPASDKEGVLQDSHWAGGAFGYFPCYTIGSLYGAQLIEAYAREHGLEDELGRGQFAPLLSWLGAHVHALGHRYSAEETVERATGTGLDASAFFRHLESRYGPAS
jgi:carboxypeptidase Taq